LQLHDIAASGGADKAGTNIGIGLRHGAYIARPVVVVEQCWVC
jgi:hypothetical protein